MDAVRKSNAALTEQLGDDAPEFVEPHIHTNLLTALRESAVLDEAVLDLLEMLPAEKLGGAVAAFTDEISRLSDRLHVLENDLTRVRVAVGPGAQVRAFSAQEEEAYARLLTWTAVVHPGFHACLLRLESIPEGIRAQVGAEQLGAFVTLSKRAALSVAQKSFKPKEMALCRLSAAHLSGRRLSLLRVCWRPRARRSSSICRRPSLRCCSTQPRRTKWPWLTTAASTSHFATTRRKTVAVKAIWRPTPSLIWAARLPSPSPFTEAPMLGAKTTQNRPGVSFG